MNDPDPDPELEQPYRSPRVPDSRADAPPVPEGRPGWLGAGLAVLSTALLCPVLMMAIAVFADSRSYAPFGVLMFLGLVQWLWLGPLWLGLRRRGEPRMARALALTGLVTMLLWGGCTGLFVFQP